MPDATSKLQAPKPLGGEAIDVAQIRSAFDLFDAAAGTTKVTSATRPNAPYDGQLIFETDTKAYGIWDATNSRWLMWDTKPQSYVPKIYGGAVAITQGAGTIAGQYFRHGLFIEFWIYTTVGAGTTYPAGTMFYGLPFEMDPNATVWVEGTAQVTDASASQIFNLLVRSGDTKKCVLATASPGLATTNYEVVLTNLNLASGAGFGVNDVTSIKGRYAAKDYVAL